MVKQAKPKVGILLFGSQRFRKLGAGTARGDYEARKAKYADTFLGHMDEIAETAFPGIVYTRNDVEKAIAFFMSEKIDCVLCSFLSWSEDSFWIAFLRDMFQVPILFYTPANHKIHFENTRDEDDFIEFLAQGGLVGSLEGSGSITRLGKNVETIVDDFDSAKKRIAAFASASRARSTLRKSRFGLLSNYNELMWSTYIDPYNFFAKIGPQLRFINYSLLKEYIDGVSDHNAREYMREIKSLYTVEEDVDERLFMESARASLALALIRDELELDALVLNDVDMELFKAIGLRPGFYHKSFNERNAVLVPEGDLGAGIVVFVLKQLTGGHVNFAEPFYIEKSTNTFSAGHAGPNDYTDEKCRHLVRVSRDVRFAKTSFKFAGAPFAWLRISPGLKTFAHFSEVNGRYKIVCFTAESLPGEHALCSYSHSDFKADRPVTELFEGILSVGTNQHFAIVDGDLRKELSIFAKICDFEFHSF